MLLALWLHLCCADDVDVDDDDSGGGEGRTVGEDVGSPDDGIPQMDLREYYWTDTTVLLLTETEIKISQLQVCVYVYVCVWGVEGVGGGLSPSGLD